MGVFMYSRTRNKITVLINKPFRNTVNRGKMTAKIIIKMDNAAFEEDAAGELSRILSDLSDRVNYGSWSDPYIIRDISGNKVGKLIVE
jgi:hypothetical protein